MEDTFAIGSCTAKSKEEFKALPLGISLPRFNFDEHFIVYNNTKGISTCYNAIINAAIEKDITYLVFAHDDIYLSDTFTFDKLHTCFNEHDADVVGVAGSKQFNLQRGLKYGRAAWHTGSERSMWSGAVYHPVKETKGQWYCTNFGPSPAKVICLDGLFLAVKVESLKKSSVKFDERFDFDFYDLDFCISCHKAGLAVYTMPIAIFHNSHGEGLLTDRYLETQKLFIKKYST